MTTKAIISPHGVALLPMVALLAVCSALNKFDYRFQSTAYDVAHSIDDYRIYIAGLIPMTSLAPTNEDHVISEGVTQAIVLPSIQLAIEHVNNDSSVLPGHVIDLAWNDTMVRHLSCYRT